MATFNIQIPLCLSDALFHMHGNLPSQKQYLIAKLLGTRVTRCSGNKVRQLQFENVPKYVKTIFQLVRMHISKF